VASTPNGTAAACKSCPAAAPEFEQAQQDRRATATNACDRRFVTAGASAPRVVSSRICSGRAPRRPVGRLQAHPALGIYRFGGAFLVTVAFFGVSLVFRSAAPPKRQKPASLRLRRVIGGGALGQRGITGRALLDLWSDCFRESASWRASSQLFGGGFPYRQRVCSMR